MMKRVEFLTSWGKWNTGDIAGFDVDTADRLLATKIVQLAGKPTGGEHRIDEIPRQRTFEHRGHGQYRVYDDDGKTILADGVDKDEARRIVKHGVPDANG